MGNRLKILIFGQPFNNFSGGGITLTNLFKGWPKESIAVIARPVLLNNLTTDICNVYYQIGNEEYRWRFPFNLYKRNFPSGLIPSPDQKSEPTVRKRPGIRQLISEKLLNPFFEWLGLSHCDSEIRISTKLRNWLIEYSPDILYIQVANREGILFAVKLTDHLKIPSLIHMMDDWPSIISDKGLFKNYWKRKIDRELRLLLNKVDLHLSICDAMSGEYKNRYGHDFLAFHNTLDLSFWKRDRSRILDSGDNEKTILFSGRIGRGIKSSLFDIASAIKLLNEKGINIKLQIQSPAINSDILAKINKYRCVVINPPADYKSLPGIYDGADILVIANDFSKEGIKFLKYSMPTKAPEYMISGTPVLVFASAETAISKFFSENDCGCCVTEPDIIKVEQAVRSLLFNREYRERITKNAVKLAEERFDGEKVRQQFFNLLNNTV